MGAFDRRGVCVQLLNSGQSSILKLSGYMEGSLLICTEKLRHCLVVFKMLCSYKVPMIVYIKDKKQAAQATAPDVCGKSTIMLKV